MKRLAAIAAAVVMIAALSVSSAGAGSGHNPLAKTLGTAPTNSAPFSHWCNTNGLTCTEPFQNWQDFPWFKKAESQVKIGEYIGHDEPSLLFYSQRAGSGNDNSYTMTLPRESKLWPKQDGSGGTWNFQLHPAFWLGMAMCDEQSSPNPAWSGSLYPNSTHCRPNSDRNIYVGQNPANAATYMGAHPGTAYMEMQFYPPGWVKWPDGVSCDGHQWCAALNIDSLSTDDNTGLANNDACLNSAGIEPVNFAYLTKNGVATSSADPLNGPRFNLSPKDYFMGSGDRIKVHMFDTEAGFTVVVNDLTNGTSGRMVASAANGFASVNFDPNATTCSLTKHGFHPEYASSSEKTTVPWAAHTYNIAYSDEIGHFEYCANPQDDAYLSCADTGDANSATENPTQDDNYCLPIPGYPPDASSLIQVSGCMGFFGDTDIDFDGVPYYAHTWPGTNANPTLDAQMAPRPVMFTSPTFAEGRNFSRVAFESDLPRIEDFRPDLPFGGITVNCQRHIKNPADPNPGQNCVLPPSQSQFYPFFSTTMRFGSCTWQEGGPFLPSISQFGGVSQYGSLIVNAYPDIGPLGNPAVTTRYNDFRQVLTNNPCPARGGGH